MKRAMSSNAKSAYNTKDKRKKYAIDQFGSDYWISDKVVLSTNKTEIQYILNTWQFSVFIYILQKRFPMTVPLWCWFLFRLRLENSLCIWLAHLFYVYWNAVICWLLISWHHRSNQISDTFSIAKERESERASEILISFATLWIHRKNAAA